MTDDILTGCEIKVRCAPRQRILIANLAKSKHITCSKLLLFSVGDYILRNNKAIDDFEKKYLIDYGLKIKREIQRKKLKEKMEMLYTPTNALARVFSLVHKWKSCHMEISMPVILLILDESLEYARCLPEDIIELIADQMKELSRFRDLDYVLEVYQDNIDSFLRRKIGEYHNDRKRKRLPF